MTTLRIADAARSSRDDGIVCCTVGEEQYALTGADVREIVRVEQMRRDVGQDGRVGTLDSGSQAVPVFDLGSVLGRAGAQARAAQGSGQHIAMTGQDGELVGWLVDRIVRTPLPEGGGIAPLPALIGHAARTWFEGLLKIGDRSVLLVAPERLNPLSRRPLRPETILAAVQPPVSKYGQQVRQLVLIFSSPALPHCEAPRYALGGRQIATIVQPLPLLVVPGSARYVTGVAWWRDLVVPVIDFRGPGEHGDAARRRRWVIAQCGARLRGALVAFAVDSDVVLHSPAAGDQQVATVPRPPFATGMFDVGGEAVALLDLDALLAPERTEAISKVQATYRIGA